MKRTLAAAAAPVTSIDWSADGELLQVSSARCELSYWRAREGRRLAAGGADASVVADAAWATFTSPLGWAAQGVLPKLSDGSDVASAHRSPDGTLLATSDDFRKVNLFRCPCGGFAAPRAAAAHAAHVPLVRFTADGAHLISVGGPDLTTAVWRIA